MKANIFLIILLAAVIWLHCTQLKNYDKETDDIDTDYGPTWFVQSDTVTFKTEGGDYNFKPRGTGKAVVKTKK